MKIEQGDIDCLIEVSVYLKSLADFPESASCGTTLLEWRQRVQKIYILLLQASEKGQLGLKALTAQGVPDDSAAAKAIRALCPFTAPKKNCALCSEGRN